MARIVLEASLFPPQMEVNCRYRKPDGGFERLSAIIDTGAQQSLFSIDLLNQFEHEILNPAIELEQAGIASQRFTAIEARIFLMLEDRLGNMTEWLAVPALFAETQIALIGFDGLLDRAELYMNFRTAREAWMDV